MSAVPESERVVVTGMSIVTPYGDGLGENLDALLAGRSAISTWKSFDTSRIYPRIGGDLGGYSPQNAIERLRDQLPPERAQRAAKLTSRVPWSTGISVSLAMQAAADAGVFASGRLPDAARCSVLVAGHNINQKYNFDNRTRFDEEPDFIEGMFALHFLDSDHAGSVSDALGALGGAATFGAACASGNLAMKHAIDDIRYHGIDLAFVVGAVFDYSPLDLHAMAIMGAISVDSFNDTPTQASRPFDRRREGFVPSHGGAVLVLESLASARRRGARIHAELLGAASSSDGSHLPHPSQAGQVRAVRELLSRTGLAPEEIDYVNAHATSTPQGDVTESRSINEIFGRHAREIRVNAPKSLLGHTCWSAAVVESVVAILQMNAGCLHACANLDDLDPEIELNLVTTPLRHEVRCFLKNSFGFGGLNCVSLFRRWEERP